MPMDREEVIEQVEQDEAQKIPLPFVDWPFNALKLHALQYGAYTAFLVGMLSLLSLEISIISGVTWSFLIFGLRFNTELLSVRIAESCPGGDTSTVYLMTLRKKPHYAMAAFTSGWLIFLFFV